MEGRQMISKAKLARLEASEDPCDREEAAQWAAEIAARKAENAAARKRVM